MAKQRFPRTEIYVFARSSRERELALERGATWAGDTPTNGSGTWTVFSGGTQNVSAATVSNMNVAIGVENRPDMCFKDTAYNVRVTEEFTVNIENQSTIPVDGDIRLVVPNGWTVSPATQPVKFARQGEKTSARFMVTAPVAGAATGDAPSAAAPPSAGPTLPHAASG
jgi:hypothetical protein